MSAIEQDVRITANEQAIAALLTILENATLASLDGTEYVPVMRADGTPGKALGTTFFASGFREITTNDNLTSNDLNGIIIAEGINITLTIPNSLGIGRGETYVLAKGTGFSFAYGTSVTTFIPQTLTDVENSWFRITKLDVDEFAIVQIGTAGGGGSADQQVAYATSLVFDATKNSTFGAVSNKHTQTAAIVFTYDLTGAVEGAVRTLEITSNGNTITFPPTNTNIVNNLSDSLLSISGNIITPENTINYLLTFWYTNGKINLIISDANIFISDITPPTFTLSPVAGLALDTDFDINATINENGTVYAVVVADLATAPTSTEVKNGTGAGGSGQLAVGNMADTGSGVTINLSGLTASTAYDVYVVAEDDFGNLQASPIKVDVSTIAAITLPDFTGDSVTRIYTTFKTAQSVKKYNVEITDGSGNDFQLFFDAAGKYSLNSKIGNNGIPSAEDLQDYIDNHLVGTVIYVSTIHCHITSHNFGTAGNNAKIWDSTLGLSVKNAETSIRFLGTAPLIGSALSELNSGNDFYMVGIASNEVTNTQHSIFNSMAASSNDYFNISNDRRTQKRIGILRDTALTFFFADDSAQDNTANVKRQTVTVDASANMVSYKNAVVKVTVNQSAQIGYGNDTAYLGGFSAGNFLDGHYQGLIVGNAAINSTQVSDINTELNVMI